jgi:hypothetical protein
MQVDPAHAELVGRVFREARRLVGEHTSRADAASRLAELCWHDIDALWDAQALVFEELDIAPTAVASDMLPLLEAAAVYYDEVQNGRRRNDTDALDIEIVELRWPGGDEP